MAGTIQLVASLTAPPFTASTLFNEETKFLFNFKFFFSLTYILRWMYVHSLNSGLEVFQKFASKKRSKSWFINYISVVVVIYKTRVCFCKKVFKKRKKPSKFNAYKKKSTLIK